MAKFSVPAFLQTYGAWQVGQQQGKLQRQQEGQAQQQEALLQTLRLIPQLNQEYEQGQARELEPIDAYLKDPNLTDESRRQYTDQRNQILQRQQAAPSPYGSDAYRNIIGQMPFGQQAASLLPSVPTRTPALGTPLPVPRYKDPHADDALQGVRSIAVPLLTQAREEKNSEVFAEVSQIIKDTHLGKITPDEATARITEAERRLGAKGSLREVSGRIEGAQKAIATALPRLSGADREAADRLLGVFDTANLGTPEGRQAAEAALGELAALRPRWKLGKTIAELDAEGRIKETENYHNDLANARTRNTNNQHIDNIHQAKTPQAKLRAIGLQRSFALSPEGQAAGLSPYGQEDFDTTPRRIPTVGESATSPLPKRTIGTTGPTFDQIGAGTRPTVTSEQYQTTREEAPPEVDARLLQEAAKELPPGSDAQQKMLYGAYGKFFDVLKSPTFATLPPVAQEKVINNLNDLGEKLGIQEDIPEEFRPGISPQLQEQIKNNKFNREQKLRAQRHREEQDKIRNQRNSELDQLKRDAATLKVDNRDPVATQEAAALKQRIGQIHAEAIKQNNRVAELEDKYRTDKSVKPQLDAEVARAEKRAQEIRQLQEEMKALRKPAATGAAPKPTDTRTFTLKGKATRGTWAQVLAEAKRAGKSEADALKKWNTGK
jgi:hypothetical protein